MLRHIKTGDIMNSNNSLGKVGLIVENSVEKVQNTYYNSLEKMRFESWGCNRENVILI